MWHGVGNAGSEPARWLSVNTPQRVIPESGRLDTYFASNGFEVEELAARAVRPVYGSPASPHIGNVDRLATPYVATAGAADPHRSAVTDHILVGTPMGAKHLTMTVVDCDVGGAVAAHDHPFEEAYFLLNGSPAAEVDGVRIPLRPGDYLLSRVSAIHRFWNHGPERARWIRVQAPQPPAGDASRWVDDWHAFNASLGEGTA